MTQIIPYILFHSTYNKLQSTFLKKVVVDHLNLLHGESEAMVREERHKDLHNMYLLLCGVKEGLSSLGKVFRELIKQNGIKVLESFKENQVCINPLLFNYDLQ